MTNLPEPTTREGLPETTLSERVMWWNWWGEEHRASSLDRIKAAAFGQRLLAERDAQQAELERLRGALERIEAQDTLFNGVPDYEGYAALIGALVRAALHPESQEEAEDEGDGRALRDRTGGMLG